MINAKNYAVSELLNIEVPILYVIPPYQREYEWGKSEWDEFFDDIYENNYGYFLGPMICVSQISDIGTQRWELIDGQQRMITLSLMLAAIYSKLSLCKEQLNDYQRNRLYNLKLKLVMGKEDTIRVIPQILKNNQRDYRFVLATAGVLRSHEDTPNAGNRRICKAYRHFLGRISNLRDNKSDNNVDAIFELLEKASQATLVKIDVDSHSNAYMLFESLNNRGVPLTAVDLIKNKLLASFGELNLGDNDPHYMNWNRLLDYLDDDYKVQERFFRQYYNAFKNTLIIENEKKGIKGSSIATRSNLVPIFEKLIERNPEDFLDKIIEAGQCYSLILHPPEDGKNSRLRKPLLDLERIQGTPSYLLLMYLIEKKKQFNLEVEHLFDIIQYLVRFFVRRNLTDFPATRELTKLFMDIIKDIDGLTDIAVVDKIKQKLAHSSTNDDVFRKHLEGPVYSENSGVVRFILCALAEKTMTQEKWKNLWAMDGKKYVWTIEHIFPQGTNIPPEWEEMIANGDKNKARKLQNEYVDLIGNLTLSGYNSALGSMSFQDKRDKKDKKTNEYIGYRNGLHLNEYLKDLPSWTDDNIKERTRLLVDETIELFKLT